MTHNYSWTTECTENGGYHGICEGHRALLYPGGVIPANDPGEVIADPMGAFGDDVDPLAREVVKAKREPRSEFLCGAILESDPSPIASPIVIAARYPRGKIRGHSDMKDKL